MKGSRHEYLKAHEAEQEKITREKLLANGFTNENAVGLAQGNNNIPTRQLNQTGYFAQQNVREYQRQMIAHVFGKNSIKKVGRGAFFDTPENLNEWIMKYFNLCMDTMVVPTISGLVTYLNCSKKQLYDHANNPNSPFYEPCKQAIDFCHLCLETGASESKINSVAYIFQAKNYFGMRDAQEIQVQATTKNEVNSAETLQALREQKEKENKGTPLEIDIREATVVDEKVKNIIEK